MDAGRLMFPSIACPMPRHSPRTTYWKMAGWLVLLAVIFFMGVLPVVERFIPPDASWSVRLGQTRSLIMQLMIALWFFAFGSMVGSFINVVVWRMPRGLSVVSQGSACPWCRARIRLADNIPVFGWIKLGGRCRVCRLPISVRYPLVEAAFGILFLVMFLVELATAAGNLPGGPWHEADGILAVVIRTQWDLIAVYAWHMTLVTLLFAWALIQADGNRIPRKMVVFGLLVGLAVAAALPWLQPVCWSSEGGAWMPGLVRFNRIASGLAGLAAGFLAGAVLDLWCQRWRPGPAGYYRNSLMISGLFLGWQALALVVFWFGVLWLAGRRIPVPGSHQRLPPLTWVVVAVVLQLCIWKPVWQLVGEGSAAAAGYGLAGLAGIALAMLAARWNVTIPEPETPHTGSS